MKFFRFFKETHIDFLGAKRYAFTFSAILALAGLLSIALHGGFRLGVDFRGGTLIQVRFTGAVQPEGVRNGLSGAGFAEAEIVALGEENEYIIRLPAYADPREITDQLGSAFAERLPDHPAEFRRVESVGPKVGAELSGKAAWAVLSALAGILIYVWFRFELHYAVGAVVALIHDVAIPLGIFSILDQEITMPVVAAFLTIIGYSLNDTIVIFDRVRENRKWLRQITQSELINRSLNETLPRTINTSLTTLLTVLSLYFVGGEVIRPFSFAMILGIVSGTYSTVYIASPVVIYLDGRARRRAAPR